MQQRTGWNRTDFPPLDNFQVEWYNGFVEKGASAIRYFISMLVCLLLITSCQAPPPRQPGSSLSSASARDMPEESAGNPELSPAPALPDNYISALAAHAASQIAEAGMTEPEKVMAAYVYMIEHTAIDIPVGMDIWRYRCADPSIPISYVENRALSPLAFGAGSCEDYAAALTVLLRAMGFEAEYVPGITISAKGGFVDHAWTMAKIGGTWYHLDCQLEDNIIKEDQLLWRYFMRSDTTMLASHRWGQNLIDYGGISPAQADEIRKLYLAPRCPEDFPTPEYRTVTQEKPPDRDALEAELALERARYERMHGPMTPVTLHTDPPVFHGHAYP